MRSSALLLAVLLCPAAPVLAQVTIDLHALDALPGVKPGAPEVMPNPRAARPVIRLPPPSPRESQQQATAPAVPAPAAPTATGTATPAVPSPPAATLPTSVPTAVAIAPVAPPPIEAQPAPPPPPPISDSSTSAATAVGSGLRVTFGTGAADLSPDSAAAIQQLVRASPPGDSTSFNVVAYAAGTPEDPSTARRLSLARALTVRSALIADGISSTRIYVRALGAATGDGPGDRVDLTVLGANAASAVPASATAQGVPTPSKSP